MFFETYKERSGTVTTAQKTTLSGAGFSAAEIQSADVLYLTPRDQDISYTVTTELPAADVGQIAKAGETMAIYLNNNIKNFKMTAATGTAKWTIALGRIYGK